MTEFSRCNFCNRTFIEAAYRKHINACPKRFEGQCKAKQRRQYAWELMLTPDNTKPHLSSMKEMLRLGKERRDRWRLRHKEFMSIVELGRGQSCDPLHSQSEASPMTIGLEQCVYCGRFFNDQAYGKHIELCESKCERLVREGSQSTAENLEATRRYRNRMNYQVSLTQSSPCTTASSKMTDVNSIPSSDGRTEKSSILSGSFAQRFNQYIEKLSSQSEKSKGSEQTSSILESTKTSDTGHAQAIVSSWLEKEDLTKESNRLGRSLEVLYNQPIEASKAKHHRKFKPTKLKREHSEEDDNTVCPITNELSSYSPERSSTCARKAGIPIKTSNTPSSALSLVTNTDTMSEVSEFKTKQSVEKCESVAEMQTSNTPRSRRTRGEKTGDCDGYSCTSALTDLSSRKPKKSSKHGNRSAKHKHNDLDAKGADIGVAYSEAPSPLSTNTQDKQIHLEKSHSHRAPKESLPKSSPLVNYGPVESKLQNISRKCKSTRAAGINQEDAPLSRKEKSLEHLDSIKNSAKTCTSTKSKCPYKAVDMSRNDHQVSIHGSDRHSTSAFSFPSPPSMKSHIENSVNFHQVNLTSASCEPDLRSTVLREQSDCKEPIICVERATPTNSRLFRTPTIDNRLPGIDTKSNLVVETNELHSEVLSGSTRTKMEAHDKTIEDDEKTLQLCEIIDGQPKHIIRHRGHHTSPHSRHKNRHSSTKHGNASSRKVPPASGDPSDCIVAAQHDVYKPIEEKKIGSSSTCLSQATAQQANEAEEGDGKVIGAAYARESQIVGGHTHHHGHRRHASPNRARRHSRHCQKKCGRSRSKTSELNGGNL